MYADFLIYHCLENAMAADGKCLDGAELKVRFSTESLMILSISFEFLLIFY